MNESTNHQFCPTLQTDVDDSLLPSNAQCVYELVINATTEQDLKLAMKHAIQEIKDNENIIQITSSNYNGELGSIKIALKDLL